MKLQFVILIDDLIYLNRQSTDTKHLAQQLCQVLYINIAECSHEGCVNAQILCSTEVVNLTSFYGGDVKYSL